MALPLPTLPPLTRDLISWYDPEAEAGRRRRGDERLDAEIRAAHARAAQVDVFRNRIAESWRASPNLRIEQVVARLLVED